jgi:hypothetical protein
VTRVQNSSVIIAISHTGKIANSENELYPFLYPVPTLLSIAWLCWAFQ